MKPAGDLSHKELIEALHKHAAKYGDQRATEVLHSESLARILELLTTLDFLGV